MINKYEYESYVSNSLDEKRIFSKLFKTMFLMSFGKDWRLIANIQEFVKNILQDPQESNLNIVSECNGVFTSIEFSQSVINEKHHVINYQSREEMT